MRDLLYRNSSIMSTPEGPMTINTDLLNRVNDFIRKYPDLHNQASWADSVALPVDSDFPFAHLSEGDLRAGEVCGTAFCFAGWAAIQAGWHQCRDREDYVVDNQGQVHHMAEAARLELGLSVKVAGELFDGLNDREIIDRYVAYLTLHPDEDGQLQRTAMEKIESAYLDEVDGVHPEPITVSLEH